jgi:hypothetical protein
MTRSTGRTRPLDDVAKRDTQAGVTPQRSKKSLRKPSKKRKERHPRKNPRKNPRDLMKNQ